MSQPAKLLIPAHIDAAGPASVAAVEDRRLCGDLAMWLVIALEMLTFGLMFVVYAVARAQDPATFRAGQASLNLHLGAVNTVILLTGSWCAARGVLALRRARVHAGARWLWGAAAFGAVFLVVKGFEYRQKLNAGYDLETDVFWMFYYLLTGFHFLHVAAAVLILAVVAFLAPRSHWGPSDTHTPETAAVFWHMVDLLWVVLFPLVYVLR
ncbi:cytochrome c oxidase subunit 3 family protein [Azohydromonas aeria]|uniref:cytochrome c oxidase subunit 3 family protein n=1 Tax=Azohydromonas aeria TaxID=2590212 RepID=UPI0012F76DC5|nr:cytochrome c oxidase subunit 3 family protein [Azohydromonas aeria]